MQISKEISNTPEGILVRLKDKIRLAIGIDIFKLKLLIDKFVITSLQGMPASRSHFAKVNIYNELSKNKMTIKVFFKFLKIINIKSVRITVTVRTIRDNEITVFEDINLFSGMVVDDDDNKNIR